MVGPAYALAVENEDGTDAHRRRFTSREEIRAGIEQLRGQWAYFVQTTHPGIIHLHGDSAAARAYIAELGRFRDGSHLLNYSVYHDRYRRTSDGWKLTERV